MAPITRLLIANRGEIACRIAHTAHRMGIDTVGVYSEPDANSLHVDVVDRAVALGGATPADSYLRADAVLEAALGTGCDAVHPGYGFLAENEAFAQLVIDAGLLWVGPTPEQISLLGDKVAAKIAAIGVGVPTVPMFAVANGSIPADVPMPVMVKAAAGGGGRGMRIVRDPSELPDAVEAASREAASAFGDGTVFIEAYIERVRHVEVQIIGDAHGNVIHLGERECSIQRRNQKIIEEAPSAGIDDTTRQVLWAGALALARAVDYRNAGTVEFLVGEGGAVNFLEVNTRLQVEHPVSEAVTGLDLVELQLAVAAGEPLPITQDDVTITGHAIEARLVAEDPANGWLASVGEVTAFAIDEGVRTDTGVRVGSAVSAEYDSMVAKVIAHAATRDGAARLLARSLQSANLAGPLTNRDTLVAILAEPDFLQAATPTSYLAEHPEVLTATGPSGDDRLALLLAAVARADRAADQHWGFVRPGWRNVATVGHRSMWLDSRGAAVSVEEQWDSATAATVLIGPWPEPDEAGALGEDERRRVAVRVLTAGEGSVALEIDGVRHAIATTGIGPWTITASGRMGGATWSLQPRFTVRHSKETGRGPICPLPGTVIAVHVEPGQEVDDGDLLMVVEAMKMEHKIVATGRGTVGAVKFAVGDRVDAGELLVEIEAMEA